jgi:plastocyanin
MSLSIAGGYSPGTATVRVGQQIFWHNTDPTEPHTATNHGAGAFYTGLIPAGGTSGPITISTAGTYSCQCDIHPVMVGTLNVTP